jgi:VanZ family protein
MRVPVPPRLVAAAGFFLMVAALFIGGSQPEAAGIFDAHWDKLAHFAYFGALAALLQIAMNLRQPLLVFVVVTAIGAADELAQTQLPGRHADLPDLATDMVAAAVVLTAMAFVRRRIEARDRSAAQGRPS